MKVISIVGARPQFVKLMPIAKAFHDKKRVNHSVIEHKIVHSGQHYDYLMDKVFFDELNIPQPDYNLEVGSASQGIQTGEILKRVEQVLQKELPDVTLVYGDTNTTLAGALAAAKLHIPIAHVEAGLRSYNKKMPEEINRILTDHCSTILFCSTKKAIENLKKEGFKDIVNNGEIFPYEMGPIFYKETPEISKPIVVNVGDIMYDVLLHCIEIADKKSKILNTLRLKQKQYTILTIHRAENTNNKNKLTELLHFVQKNSFCTNIIFPAHPRTKNFIEKHNIPLPQGIKLIEPLSYFDMILLLKHARLAFTDSGGLQKEAYWLKVPCITLRDETEWVETVEAGWNILYKDYKGAHSIKDHNPNLYGDGHAGERIIEIIMRSKE